MPYQAPDCRPVTRSSASARHYSAARFDQASDPAARRRSGQIRRLIETDATVHFADQVKTLRKKRAGDIGLRGRGVVGDDCIFDSRASSRKTTAHRRTGQATKGKPGIGRIPNHGAVRNADGPPTDTYAAATTEPSIPSNAVGAARATGGDVSSYRAVDDLYRAAIAVNPATLTGTTVARSAASTALAPDPPIAELFATVQFITVKMLRSLPESKLLMPPPGPSAPVSPGWVPPAPRRSFP